MRLEDPRDLETRVRALRCELAGDRVILAGIRVLLALERRAHFDPAQPRDELGRWAEIGRSTTYPITDPNAEADPAPKDERIRVAGPFDYGSVDLRFEEGYEGGHTISRHVSKTPEELAARVAWESSRSDRVPRKGWRAGTFSSLAAANDFVERALVANAAIVEAVGVGALPNAPIKFDFGRTTGFEAVLDSKIGPVRFRETNGVHIYIIHDKNLLKGFRIHTAYPINLE